MEFEERNLGGSSMLYQSSCPRWLQERESCDKIGSSDEDTEIVKILAPLTDNPNSPTKWGDTPIYLAASNGHTEIVKILAPLTNNHNVPDGNGMTPIKWALNEGHTEILYFLALLNLKK